MINSVKEFASSLAAALNSWTEIMDLFNYFQLARNFSDYVSYVGRQFELLRDNLNRMSSEIIEMSWVNLNTVARVLQMQRLERFSRILYIV